MIVGAAFCPHPPALLPELGRGVSEFGEIRGACRTALDELYALEPDRIVVVGSGPTSSVHAASAWGTTAAYGVDRRYGYGEPADDAATLPLSLTVGAYLLGADAERGFAGSITPRSVAPGDNARVAGEIRAEANGGATALLVMGDGSARRDTTAPGYLDERARPFDEIVEGALRDGDWATLAALDEVLAAQLLVAGAAPWRVAGRVFADTDIDAHLILSTSPFGVAYFVATWRPR